MKLFFLRAREEESGTEQIDIGENASLALSKAMYRGSATLVFVLLEEKLPIIRTLNLGDCSYMHLRFNNQKGKLQILFKAAEMQKNFNAPYQAASMSPGDDPRSGMKETHDV